MAQTPPRKPALPKRLWAAHSSLTCTKPGSTIFAITCKAYIPDLLPSGTENTCSAVVSPVDQAGHLSHSSGDIWWKAAFDNFIILIHPFGSLYLRHRHRSAAHWKLTRKPLLPLHLPDGIKGKVDPPIIDILLGSFMKDLFDLLAYHWSKLWLSALSWKEQVVHIILRYKPVNPFYAWHICEY
jgi:hypothetical protein